MGRDESDSDCRTADLVQGATRHFRLAFGEVTPAGCAVAPGRVNLIGEHTDYNDGFVLPMAIDRYVAVAFGPNDSGVLHACSDAYGESHSVELCDLGRSPSGTWFDYVEGVAWALRERGVELRGVDLAVTSNLPVSAGLSSSAAIELATIRALSAVSGLPWDPVEAARIGQRAENEYVGVQCGIMDQLVVAVAVEGSALLVDCRTLDHTPIPMPDAALVVVMDTGAPRDLAATGYNERRACCEAAVAAIRTKWPEVRSLRDVDGPMLSTVIESLDPVTYRRAQHVVGETARPTDMARALQAGDLARCGVLMEDSHWSLRDLYEVSCPELDLMTQLARSHPACFGARLTGAGFGGCAVALVDARQVESFAESVMGGYRSSVDLPAAMHVCRPVSGVALY